MRASHHRRHILDWQVADKKEQAAWERLVQRCIFHTLRNGSRKVCGLGWEGEKQFMEHAAFVLQRREVVGTTWRLECTKRELQHGILGVSMEELIGILRREDQQALKQRTMRVL